MSQRRKSLTLDDSKQLLAAVQRRGSLNVPCGARLLPNSSGNEKRRGSVIVRYIVALLLLIETEFMYYAFGNKNFI